MILTALMTAVVFFLAADYYQTRRAAAAVVESACQDLARSLSGCGRTAPPRSGGRR
jgi:hypothetical protein